MKNLLVLLCAMLIGLSLQAQLLTAKTEFTKADTLRGTLNAERAWFNVYYYNLELTINPDKQYISGFNDVYFEALVPGSRMQLDLFDIMQIDSIKMGEETIDYTREFDAFFMDLPEMNKGDRASLRIYYQGEPIYAENPPWDGGFVWREDSNGKDFIGVACEGMGASSWWPNKDHLSDEPDSMRISMAVPNDIVYVGNGNLRSKSSEGDYTRYNWFVANPINNYNVTVNAGDYANFHDVYTYEDGEELRIDYYVLQENIDTAKGHLRRWTLPMMDCYEQYLGKYPFMEDGVAFVETPYLGMEHQSAIAYGNGFQHGYAGHDYSGIGLEFDYIIIHEMGHEWWGNSISCADMADLWIHEGFCTYTEAIYVECMYDYEKGQEYVNAKKRTVGNKAPIQGRYGVNEEGDSDMYNKGMLFLNTMRHAIDNDELWWSIIKGLTIDFYHTTTDARAIQDYFNEKTGKNYDLVFDQYLTQAAIPIFEYKTREKGKCTILDYRWVSDIEGFDLPFKYKDGKGNWQTIQPSADWQTVEIKKLKSADLELGDNFFYVETKNVSDSGN